MLEKIFEKLENHTKILEGHSKILERHTQKLESHDRKFEEHDRKFDRLIEQMHRFGLAQEHQGDKIGQILDILDHMQERPPGKAELEDRLATHENRIVAIEHFIKKKN